VLVRKMSDRYEGEALPVSQCVEQALVVQGKSRASGLKVKPTLAMPESQPISNKLSCPVDEARMSQGTELLSLAQAVSLPEMRWIKVTLW
jgi:hypothetical protein